MLPIRCMGYLASTTPLLPTPRSLPVQVLLTPVHLGIVLEYAAGGDMFQHVKRSGGLEEADARWFYQQLMIALDYMHSRSWLRVRLHQSAANPASSAAEAAHECAGYRTQT